MPETLALVAELALGLAGFTGVLVVLGRQPGRFSAGEAFRLAILLVGSLSALFLSLAPLVLHDLGVAGPALWRTASGFMAVTLLGSAVLLAGPTRRFRAGRHEAYSPWVLTSVASGAVLVFFLQLLNGLGVAWPPNPGVFTLGLVFFLASAAVQFVRILFVRSDTPDA
jgi:hypothetical protein